MLNLSTLTDAQLEDTYNDASLTSDIVTGKQIGRAHV